MPEERDHSSQRDAAIRDGPAADQVRANTSAADITTLLLTQVSLQFGLRSFPNPRLACRLLFW